MSEQAKQPQVPAGTWPAKEVGENMSKKFSPVDKLAQVPLMVSVLFYVTAILIWLYQDGHQKWDSYLGMWSNDPIRAAVLSGLAAYGLHWILKGYAMLSSHFEKSDSNVEESVEPDPEPNPEPDEDPLSAIESRRKAEFYELNRNDDHTLTAEENDVSEWPTPDSGN